jgi:ABC-type ATPase involved in cell division
MQVKNNFINKFTYFDYALEVGTAREIIVILASLNKQGTAILALTDDLELSNSDG